MQTNAKRITLTYGETDNNESAYMRGAPTEKQRRDRPDARRYKPPSLTPRAALQNPRNIPYIDGFGILKLPEDPGILRNSSELFENSRNFTRFLF